MRRLLFLNIAVVISTGLFAKYDWDGIVVPAESDNSEVTWELVEGLSDDFNYETPYGTNKGDTFNLKWEDGYINTWPGFGNTTWTPDNSRVTGGNLEFKATVNPNKANCNYFSAIHAKEQIIYPAYIETRVKIMNSVMANAVWMLSDNSNEEIDIVEAYGSSYSESAGSTKEWFAQRMHLSHHTFSESRDDYQPSTASGSYYRLPDGSYWRDAFHSVGVYWRDPFHLEYYVNGKLVRTVSGPDIIDPNEHLNGNGLTLPETIIVSGAAQQWQVDGGVYPTDSELAVEEDNIFKVDWIRTYKRIGGDEYVPPSETSINSTNNTDKVIFANPIANDITVKAENSIEKIEFYSINGNLAKEIKIELNASSYSVSSLVQGIYIMKIIDKNGGADFVRIIKE